MIAPALPIETQVIAEEQEEYKPVVAGLVRNPEFQSVRPDGVNTLVLCFRPTPEERKRLAENDDIYIWLLTFGGPMQPIIVSCGKEEAMSLLVPPDA